MIQQFVLAFVLLTTVFAQDNDWLCESLICDPPKRCILVDQVAQCLVDETSTTPFFGTINGGEPLFSLPPPLQPNPSSTVSPFTFPTDPPENNNIATQPPPTSPPPTPTTPPSPFAPFLSLFGGGGGGAQDASAPTIIPPFTLPTFPALPTLPTTPPPTTPQPADICSLPPLTGSCNRARIMWYYDIESRRCERFSWSGCGNGNRFASKMQCEQTCSQSSAFRRNS